jgi:hypothetical protein
MRKIEGLEMTFFPETRICGQIYEDTRDKLNEEFRGCGGEFKMWSPSCYCKKCNRKKRNKDGAPKRLKKMVHKWIELDKVRGICMIKDCDKLTDKFDMCSRHYVGYRELFQNEEK